MNTPTTFVIFGRAVLNQIEQADGTIVEEPGGSAFVQAELIKKSLPDAKVILLTDLGNDEQGEKFKSMLAAAGIIVPDPIPREVIEVKTPTAYWAHGAKTHDASRSYLQSPPIEYSMLPSYQIPKTDGPIIEIVVSEATTIDWARCEGPARQLKERNALSAFFPNSRPDSPDKPENRILKDQNLPIQFQRAHLVQFATKDMPHMFGEEFSEQAMRTLMDHNPRAWFIVTDSENPVRIFKPDTPIAAQLVETHQIYGLPAKYNKVNAGTVFGGALLVDMGPRGLKTSAALMDGNPDIVLAKLAKSVAYANQKAAERVAINNNISPVFVCERSPPPPPSLFRRTAAFLKTRYQATSQALRRKSQAFFDKPPGSA